jgi:uncharacterized membrane protein YeaQ/YmgE (transglycosylase-associated protein family)
MGFLAYIIVGLIAGALAKAIMPGTDREPGGFLGTMLLGVVGAVVGGWTWNIVLNQPGATGVNIGSIIVALVGACLVIGLMRLFTRSRV